MQGRKQPHPFPGNRALEIRCDEEPSTVAEMRGSGRIGGRKRVGQRSGVDPEPSFPVTGVLLETG